MSNQRETSLDESLDALDRTIRRIKTKWFWMGVICGMLGTYLGSLIHV